MMTVAHFHGLLAQATIQDLFQPEVRVVALSTLGIASAVFGVGYFLIFYVLRLWFRRINSDAGLVAIRVSQIPALIVGISTVLKLTLFRILTIISPEVISQVAETVEEAAQPAAPAGRGGKAPRGPAIEVTGLTSSSTGVTAFIEIIQHILSAVIAVVVTYWIAQLLKDVVLYYLKKYAEQSEAEWDDVLVPILETTLPVITYMVGGLVALQSLGIDLSGLWVAIGGITFVLGFALKDILANFFSGLVLLIDTPFRFGDVVTLEDGTRAVIKKVGLRVTNLYVIDQHSELYLPNAVLQGQEIINLSRPTTDYYYTITVPIKFDADPVQVTHLIESVILAHPDTLGKIEQKLELIDQFYGISGSGKREQQKREAGRFRLLAEQAVNARLLKVEDALDVLVASIGIMEQSGLDAEELQTLQMEFKNVCDLIGFTAVVDRQGKISKGSVLEIIQNPEEPHLIDLIRQWYQSWLKDPDLSMEDQKVLPREWEQKLELLKQKATRLFRSFSSSSMDETRLDDAVDGFYLWMQESFKTTRNEWQQPRIWMSSTKLDGGTQGSNKTFTVKFYVDDITLEHFQRGYRVESEVNRELNWQLRQAYLAR